jgi:Type II secretion system (T2SS), protein K
MSTARFSPRSHVGPRPARRGGSVIVVVLVTLLLASLMLTKFMENSAVELTLATRQADRERLRADAYSALETALAVMAEIKAVDEDLYSPEQGWNDPYGYAGESPREGVSAEFTFTDESGKISLPRLSFDEMVELAQALGLGENDARRFSDGLFAWTTADHTPQDIEAEASRYEREAIPHRAPRRSLRSWDELRAVRVAREYVYDEKGALTAFGQALRDNLSLYDYQSSNVNALAPAVGVWRGWDVTQTAALASYQAGKGPRVAGAPPWFRGMEEVRTILGANAEMDGLDASVKLVRVEVTAREGQASMRLAALVGIDDSVQLPQAATSDENGGQSGGGSARRGDREQGSGETRRGSAGGNRAVEIGRPGGGTRPGNRSENGGRGGNVRPGGRGGENSGAATPARPRISLLQAQAPGGAFARRAGGNPTGGATSGGSAASEEKLDYPFRILEVIESAGPAPVPPVEANEEEAPLS